jgi:predicted  nucleic acid-binding Zn-ribbon protein
LGESPRGIPRVRSYKPPLIQIEDRPLQLQDYTQQLSSTEKRIETDKSALRSDLTRASDDFRVDEFDADQELRRLSDEQQRIKHKQEECSDAMKSQQWQLAELKAEASRMQ